MSGEQTFNLNLVKEIQKYPCLYNYTIVGYSLKDVTDKAWSDVGKAVNLNENECKERWKNLRAVYVRHKKHARNGTAITRKPYYLEEAMEFTLPYIKTLYPTPGNISSTSSYETVYCHDQNEDTKSSDTTQSPEPHVPSVTTEPIQEQDNMKSIKKRPNQGNNDVQNYFGYKISRVSDNVDPTRDANTLFLLSLLPDLNGMTSQQIRTFKKKVLELIDETLLNNITMTLKVESEIMNN